MIWVVWPFSRVIHLRPPAVASSQVDNCVGSMERMEWVGNVCQQAALLLIHCWPGLITKQKYKTKKKNKKAKSNALHERRELRFT